MHPIFYTRIRLDYLCLETFGPVMGDYGFEIFLEFEGLPRNSLFLSIGEKLPVFKNRWIAEQMGYLALIRIQKAAQNWKDKAAYYQELQEMKKEICRVANKKS